MATIQWFPGHMSKARRQVQENLKFVDFVTILVDARLPLSSQNPMLTKIVGDKPKLLILNKADLADPAMTKEWRQYLKSRNSDSCYQLQRASDCKSCNRCGQETHGG